MNYIRKSFRELTRFSFSPRCVMMYSSIIIVNGIEFLIEHERAWKYGYDYTRVQDVIIVSTFKTIFLLLLGNILNSKLKTTGTLVIIIPCIFGSISHILKIKHSEFLKSRIFQ